MSGTGSVRPQLKHTSPAFARDGVTYIGGYGEITQIPDKSGVVHRLLELLDGTRTVPQVHRDLVEEFPDVTLAEVEAGIGQFDEARYLLDAAAAPDGMLDEYELSRWERNINFFGSYATLADNKHAFQRRLLDCRIALLGLGGLGSHLLLDLAAIGVGHVRAVEFDRVVISNLNRQILYRDADLGRPKLELATARVREFNPRIDIEPLELMISSPQDVVDIATGVDLVVCVADRPKMEIMHWVNEGCVRTGTPLVTGGLETQRAVHYTMIPGTTGCVECWRRQVLRDDPLSGTLLTDKRERGISGDNAAFGPLVTMTTGLLLGEVVRLITGVVPPVAAGRMMQLRFDDYAYSEAERWQRDPDCPLCGPANGSDSQGS